MPDSSSKNTFLVILVLVAAAIPLFLFSWRDLNTAPVFDPIAWEEQYRREARVKEIRDRYEAIRNMLARAESAPGAAARIQAYDEIIDKYTHLTDFVEMAVVIEAYTGKAAAMPNPVDKFKVYDEGIARFQGTNEYFGVKALAALYMARAKSGEGCDEKNRLYDELIAGLSDKTEISAMTTIADAYFAKAYLTKNPDEKIRQYDAVILAYGRSHDVAIQDSINKAYEKKIALLTDPAEKLRLVDERLDALAGTSLTSNSIRVTIFKANLVDSWEEKDQIFTGIYEKYGTTEDELVLYHLATGMLDWAQAAPELAEKIAILDMLSDLCQRNPKKSRLLWHKRKAQERKRRLLFTGKD